MDAMFNKNLIIVLIMILGFPTISCGSNASDEKKLAEKLMSFARQDFLDKKEKTEKIIKVCREKEKNTVLTPSIFEKIKISSRELEIALFFLNREARDACEGDHLARFYVASSRYRTTAKHFDKEAPEASPYTEDMLFGSSWRDLRIKSDYMSISKKSRQALEEISALKKPFDLHRTLEALGSH